ncbi:hypothetical protein [Amycolatopsis ultiminotia]|uniref:hypothetical protein n=1 Tax=Amycolatopsis ultiminotia TaxID=543629 RepID=UPI0031EEB4B1
MRPIGEALGAAGLQPVGGGSLLRPGEQVFSAMLSGLSATSSPIRPLRLPAQIITRQAALPKPERIALLGQLLSGHDLPSRSRAAAVIGLLCAQPFNRIARLTATT